MKVPLSWLREFVAFEDDAEGLARKLTFSGTEVEGIERIRTGLDGVLVGEILEVKPHPSADRLSLCMVYDGSSTHQVVCGASNMTKGDKAAFAPCGITLPNGVSIRKAKLRGEDSFGMLCAQDELGLSEDHGGILILEPSMQAGVSLCDALGGEDQVIDLEITWNRSDCLSIAGIAREVSALYRSPLRLPDSNLQESAAESAGRISVSVESAIACPRYTGRYISSVKVGSSPLWMQLRLLSCGIRPVNNVVDITNYIMLETGHPLHAFDYRKVPEGNIMVRFARNNEAITTLDGANRKLSDGILVIADSSKALAVAGVMGGAGSEISTDTTEVLLESATFDPAVIHHAVVELGLNSESSHRFERGVDYRWVDFASRRAAKLMHEIAGASVGAGLVDHGAGEPAARRISLSARKVSDVIGVEMSASECEEILSSLQFEAGIKGDGLNVVIPGFRRDVELDADLIEEIARIKGLDAVPAAMPSCYTVNSMDDTKAWERDALRDRFLSAGLVEAVNYSFMSEKLAARGSDVNPGVKLPNPVSADYSVMRGTLIPQMVDILGRNLAHQIPDCACFEIGKIFREKKGSAPIEEGERVCVGLMGKVGRYSMDRRAKLSPAESFLWLKGLLDHVFSATGLSMSFRPADLHLFERGSCVQILFGENHAGYMGVLSSELRGEYRMLEPVAIAEVDISYLHGSRLPRRSIAPLPAFPETKRDIAIIVSENTLHGDVVAAIEGADCPELTYIELFDIFRGKGTGEGMKSMAYSLTFQSSVKTLTDEEANAFRDRICGDLVEKLNAEIREG